jgi:hypothetical protein
MVAVAADSFLGMTVTAHEGLRLGCWIMVVARICARALVSLVRLSLWFDYLSGSIIISLVSSSGCCSVRRRAGNAGNAGLSLYGLMSRECFLSFL